MTFQKMKPRPTPRKDIGAFNWLYDIDNGVLYYDERAGASLYHQAAMLCLHIPFGEKKNPNKRAAIYSVNRHIHTNNVLL